MCVCVCCTNEQVSYYSLENNKLLLLGTRKWGKRRLLLLLPPFLYRQILPSRLYAGHRSRESTRLLLLLHCASRYGINENFHGQRISIRAACIKQHPQKRNEGEKKKSLYLKCENRVRGE